MADKPVVRATDLLGAAWYKSSYSGSDQSSCVEIADLRAGLGKVAVRDSKDPDGAALVFESAAFAAFVTDAADGTYDF